MKSILKVTVAALAPVTVTIQVQLPFMANDSSLITTQVRQGGHHSCNGHKYYKDRSHHNTCLYGCEGYRYHHEDFSSYESPTASDNSLIFVSKYYVDNNTDMAEKYRTDAAFLLGHFVEYSMNAKQGGGCKAFDIHLYMVNS